MSGFTIDLDKEALDALTDLVNKNSNLLLHIPQVRELITYMRLKGVSDVEQYDSAGDAVHDHAIIHNLNGLSAGQAQHRPALLFSSIMGIEYIRHKAPNLNMLIIGPRSENELFTAYSYGFKPENVKAIDLISYSNLIELGDMHDLPYDDDTFDLVVAGWVLAYSSDNQRAADEMIRVCKPLGHIAVGCVAEVSEPRLQKHYRVAVGGLPCESDDPERPGLTKTVSRYWNADQILRLFNEHIDTVIVKDEPHPELRNIRANLITVFRVK